MQSLHLIAPRVVVSKDGPAVSCARVLWGWLLDKWGGCMGRQDKRLTNPVTGVMVLSFPLYM